MKTLKFLLVVILLSLNFVSCDPPSVNEDVGIELLETCSLHPIDGQDEGTEIEPEN